MMKNDTAPETGAVQYINHYLVTVVCMFGHNSVVWVVEKLICAKCLQTDGQTDGRTDDGRRAIALTHEMS